MLTQKRSVMSSENCYLDSKNGHINTNWRWGARYTLGPELLILYVLFSLILMIILRQIFLIPFFSCEEAEVTDGASRGERQPW